MKSNQEENSKIAAELYLQLFDHLYALAYRILGRTDLAEDAVANTFLKWMTCPPEFHARINKPKSYLIRMVSTEAFRMKEYQRRLVTLQDFNWDERHAVSLMGQLFKKASSSELVQLLLTALEQRYPKSRYAQILRLFYISEYSHKEIAETLEITVANSKVTLRRAKLACCRLYKELFPDDDPSVGARGRDHLDRPGKIYRSDERDIDPTDQEQLDRLSCKPPEIRDAKIRYLNNGHEFRLEGSLEMELLLREFENDPDQLLNYLQKQKTKLQTLYEANFEMDRPEIQAKIKVGSTSSSLESVEVHSIKDELEIGKERNQNNQPQKFNQEIEYVAQIKEQVEAIDSSLSAVGSGDDLEAGPPSTELDFSEFSIMNLYNGAKEKIRKQVDSCRRELERSFTVISFSAIETGETTTICNLRAHSLSNQASWKVSPNPDKWAIFSPVLIDLCTIGEKDSATGKSETHLPKLYPSVDLFSLISAHAKTVSLQPSAGSLGNTAELPYWYFPQTYISAVVSIDKVSDTLTDSQTERDVSRLFDYWELKDKVLLSRPLGVENSKLTSSSEAPSWSIDFDSYDSIHEPEEILFPARKKQDRGKDASNKSELDWEINYTTSQRVRFIPYSIKVQGIFLPEDLTMAPPEISHKAKPIYYQLLDHFRNMTANGVYP